MANLFRSPIRETYSNAATANKNTKQTGCQILCKVGTIATAAYGGKKKMEDILTS